MLTRRRFLAYTGAATASGLLLDRYMWAARHLGSDLATDLAAFMAPNPGTPSFTWLLRRPQDQLHLGFEFYNLTLNTTNIINPVLVPTTTSAPSYIVVVFPPQSLAEEAVFDTAGTAIASSPDTPVPAADAPPVQSRLAGASRLAFQIPPSVTSIPFNSQSLLSWDTWGTPSIVPWAVSQVTPDPHPPAGGSSTESAAGYPLIRQPTAVETTLEIPWRLVLSPNETAQWAHSTTPVTANGLTELWHTRLGIAGPGGTISEAPGGNRTLRAIYALDPDFQSQITAGDGGGSQMGPPEAQDGLAFPQGEDPFLGAMYANDRYSIVYNSADYVDALPPNAPPTEMTPGNKEAYTPTPIETVNFLMLSPLGGFVDLQGDWNNTDNNPLVQWKHKATLGRDHYVKLVKFGFLLPTGHPAVLVEETQRKFDQDPSGNYTVAYLRKREYVVVKGPVKQYGDGNAHGCQFDERQWPFRTVEITTLVTPDLDPITPYCSPSGDANPPFVPTINNPNTNSPVPFQFHCKGTDWNGTVHDFTTGMVFVFSVDAFSADGALGHPAGSDLTTICAQYNSNSDPGNHWAGGPDDLKVRPFNGQKVNFAEVTKHNETALQTETITWGVEPPAGGVQAPPGSLIPDPFQAANQPQFYPVVKLATVHLRTAEAVTGGTAIPPQAITINGTETTSSFSTTPLNAFGLPQAVAGYVAVGFATGNPSQAYVTLTDPSGHSLEQSAPLPPAPGKPTTGGGPGLGFGGGRSGANLTPNLTVGGLSRTGGIMAGNLKALMSGNFDPISFFAGGGPEDPGGDLAVGHHQDGRPQWRQPCLCNVDPVPRDHPTHPAERPGGADRPRHHLRLGP